MRTTTLLPVGLAAGGTLAASFFGGIISAAILGGIGLFLYNYRFKPAGGRGAVAGVGASPYAKV